MLRRLNKRWSTCRVANEDLLSVFLAFADEVDDGDNDADEGDDAKDAADDAARRWACRRQPLLLCNVREKQKEREFQHPVAPLRHFIFM